MDLASGCLTTTACEGLVKATTRIPTAWLLTLSVLLPPIQRKRAHILVEKTPGQLPTLGRPALGPALGPSWLSKASPTAPSAPLSTAPASFPVMNMNDCHCYCCLCALQARGNSILF
jgi:hypothetical protein